MTDTERRDERNGTNRAVEIRQLANKIKSANEDLVSVDNDVIAELQTGPRASENVSAHYSVSYAVNSGNTRTLEDSKRQRINSLRQQILRLIDPYGYLRRYKGSGRAIDG